MNKEFEEEIISAIRSLELDVKSIMIIASNGKFMQGIAKGLESLGRIDKVDLVVYLLKHLEITIEDIEDAKELSDETKLMLKIIKKGRFM